MYLTEQGEREIDLALRAWHQGDFSLDPNLEFVHLADLNRPHSPASIQIAESLTIDGDFIDSRATPVLDENVRGVVMLSQTCDVVRSCRKRPFVEVSPLIEVNEQRLEEIRRLKRPAFAYIPTAADRNLVADLDRVMTMEKSLIAGLSHNTGCRTDDDRRNFANALARKRTRFAFPDEFVAAAQNLKNRLIDKHNSNSVEGAHCRALQEIRVSAKPSWDDEFVELDWWFIKENDPDNVQVNWTIFLDSLLDRFDESSRFRLGATIACRLEDMTARDYVESDYLDLDRLSIN